MDLICRADKSVMVKDGDLYRCTVCDIEYPVRQGVAISVEQDDDFYEGAYDNIVKFVPRSEKPWHVWPLWLLNSGYVWEARRALPEGARVIELGCAAGVRYFGQRYEMIGCDLNFTALSKIDFYDLKVQTDAAVHIPLPDGSVDGVVSSFFWEHIPPALKPGILAECRRVLKDGGRMIFLYDVETENPRIARYRKRDRARYDQLFIEGDGHFGYQTPAENLALFADAGFALVRHKGLEKTWLQSAPVVQKLRLFDAPAPGAAPAHGRLRFYLMTAAMRFIDTVVCPLLPARWARIDLVVLRKAGR